MSKELLEKQCLGFLNTPPLWEKKQFGIQQFGFPDIDLARFSPTPIPQNIRLGHQMEHVFKQLVTYSKNYEVLLHNLPIRHEKLTLGEIDFILKDASNNELIHVELTYKFYIVNLNIVEPMHRLIGPNKRDLFFSKLEKIKNEQFTLLHSKIASKVLSENGIDHSEIRHQCCFKAQLFMPYGSVTFSIEPLNSNCIAGYWLRFDDFNSTDFKRFQFYIPCKSEWVLPPHDKVIWKSHSEIITAINLRHLKESAPMIWMRKSKTSFEKFFVVWWKR